MDLLKAFEFGDFIWAVIWFIVGLIVFDYPSAKKLCDILSAVVSLIGLYGIATQPNLLAIHFLNVPLSYVIGVITNFIYLIGANISRSDHMDVPFAWGRVIFYFFAIIILTLFTRYLVYPQLQ